MKEITDNKNAISYNGKNIGVMQKALVANLQKILNNTKEIDDLKKKIATIAAPPIFEMSTILHGKGSSDTLAWSWSQQEVGGLWTFQVLGKTGINLFGLFSAPTRYVIELNVLNSVDFKIMLDILSPGPTVDWQYSGTDILSQRIVVDRLPVYPATGQYMFKVILERHDKKLSDDVFGNISVKIYDD